MSVPEIEWRPSSTPSSQYFRFEKQNIMLASAPARALADGYAGFRSGVGHIERSLLLPRSLTRTCNQTVVSAGSSILLHFRLSSIAFVSFGEVVSGAKLVRLPDMLDKRIG